MNKFVKFPLILGIVCTVCGGVLSVVYEVTKDKIAYNANKEVFDLLGGIVPSMDSAEKVNSNYSSAELSSAKIVNVYAISENNKVTSYGYQAEVVGYNPGIKFVVVLSSTEEVIVGFNVIEHNETNAQNYGGILLNSPEFSAQFENLPFDELTSNVDLVAGSTANITLEAVKNGVDRIISFHKANVFGQEVSSIDLTSGELEKLALPEGQELVDKTSSFLETLKSKVSENAYKNIINSLGLLNYAEIVDSNESVQGYAYIVDGEYSCEVSEGKRETKEYKLVFQLDTNFDNTKVTIVKTTDSLGAIGRPSIDEDPWLAESFNGFSIDELNTKLAEDEIDKIAGATFSSNAIRAKVAVIVNAHIKAYGKGN